MKRQKSVGGERKAEKVKGSGRRGEGGGGGGVEELGWDI